MSDQITVTAKYKTQRISSLFVTSFLLLVLCWTSLTGPFCLPVKEFHGTRYQSGSLFLNFMWGVVFTDKASLADVYSMVWGGGGGG